MNETKKEHRCFAVGCEMEIPRNRGMCGKHWRMVPKPLQHDIYQTYREGDLGDLSRLWIDARKIVKEKEGK